MPSARLPCLIVPPQVGARTTSKTAEVLNPGIYRPHQPRPDIFTAEYVAANPRAAAAVLNSCYYDLVDLENRAAAELAAEVSRTDVAARMTGPQT